MLTHTPEWGHDPGRRFTIAIALSCANRDCPGRVDADQAVADHITDCVLCQTSAGPCDRQEELLDAGGGLVRWVTAAVTQYGATEYAIPECPECGVVGEAEP